MSKIEKFIAREVYFEFQGVKISYQPMVYSTVLNHYVAIKHHPCFKTPEAAIRWAMEIWA